MTRAPGRGAILAQHGMAGIAMVCCVALSLVVFVSLADVVTMLFARSAVRAAVDEAVRVGARSDAPERDCEARARAVLDGLLGPATRAGVVVRCTASPDAEQVEATADATLAAWWPGLPAWTFTVRAASVREELP